MDYSHLIDTMSPQIYRRLVRSLELGKWPDGKPLTGEQRANAMQAVIAWGERHLPAPERVGHIERKEKVEDQCDAPAETPLKWKE